MDCSPTRSSNIVLTGLHVRAEPILGTGTIKSSPKSDKRSSHLAKMSYPSNMRNVHTPSVYSGKRLGAVVCEGSEDLD
ncbi:hypothetical protein Q1695_000425 [Nippostrongylus brasiliensis]|nr:hypothetical protein Q1695_000425 [Nippostrongylus brasiliensis]